MSEKQIEKNKKKIPAHTWISVVVICLMIPVVLMASRYFGNRKYYLCSMVLIILSMVPFFLSFEKRKPEAREIVTLAVMCAIAVASRAAFIMLPHFKPLVGIVIITGMAFGAESGFLTGAVSAFVSNFIFGQGPWTPWQMFAYGIAGFLAGLLTHAGILKKDKNVPAAIFGGLEVLLVTGPLLDTCSLFLMTNEINKASAAAIYASGLPVNAIHALATFLTVLLLEKPIMEKLDRIKVKYGMMEEDEA